MDPEKFSRIFLEIGKDKGLGYLGWQKQFATAESQITLERKND